MIKLSKRIMYMIGTVALIMGALILVIIKLTAPSNSFNFKTDKIEVGTISVQTKELNKLVEITDKDEISKVQAKLTNASFKNATNDLLTPCTVYAKFNDTIVCLKGYDDTTAYGYISNKVEKNPDTLEIPQEFAKYIFDLLKL